ncbi:TPA: ThiF family adenylyltransferase [Providencia rettgeri]|nr:ThiF family adenylyltransferase [Providencia rettgeri]HEC8326510.1 ThiF family adenylyltransferase [Providencia rettgeri]
MMWWIYHKSRLDQEKTAVSDLESNVEWLHIEKWQSNNELVMSVTFEVSHLGKSFRFRMEYPNLFPDLPPMVYTEDKIRVSGHQYGAEGELCLEHRPDNWTVSITGADMISSLHRLLSQENNENGYITHAHSAHVPSLGRELRSQIFRFLITSESLKALNEMPEKKIEQVLLRNNSINNVFVTSLIKIGDKDHTIWSNDLEQPDIKKDIPSFAVRLSNASIPTQVEFADITKLLNYPEMTELRAKLQEKDTLISLVLGDGDNWVLLSFFGDINDRKVIRFTTIQTPEHKKRLPADYLPLYNKRVGIVGCGSIGSKIASSLCRSGIGNFLFIDDDIFFPDNTVRNDLDLSHIGFHKAHALKDRLQKINPKTKIQTLRLALGGQESSNSMSGALESLGNCDLIIDATANPSAFTLISSMSKRKKKPMVWVEVFGGGIGGIVARSRPEFDPIPLLARNQIDQWCTENGVDVRQSVQANDYSVQKDDGVPLVADDAEVSIMSAHAARFATDILARPNNSIFPYSAYIIGMSSEWVFNEPFDTRPIDLQLQGEWGETCDVPNTDEICSLLKEYLLPKDELNANNSSK